MEIPADESHESWLSGPSWGPKVKGAGTWLRSWWHAPDPNTSEGFLDNEQWALNYTPARNEDIYSLTSAFAQARYAEVWSVSESLDKKFDDLAKTVIAIVVIVATVTRGVGTVATISRSPLLATLAVLTTASFALSLLVSICSRGPAGLGTPLTIRDLLTVVDSDDALGKDKVEGLLSASFHLAVVETNASNVWKAKQLQRAITLLVGGVSLLLVLLIILMPSSSSSSQEEQAEVQKQSAVRHDTPRNLARSSFEPSR